MSDSSLFYAKAMTIVEHLHSIADTLAEYGRECRGMTVGPADDNRVRVVLSTPNVVQLVRETFQLNDCRIRFAFDANPGKARIAQLEIYNVDGSPFGQPILVSNLSHALSMAVENELMMLLLRSKGMHINPY